MGPAVSVLPVAVPRLSPTRASEDSPRWPEPDQLVLHARQVRAGTPASKLSRFVDPVWVLQPAHPDAHHVVNSVRWHPWPHELVRQFKTVAMAMLTELLPEDEAIRTGCGLLGIDTVSIKLRNMRVFAEWMHERGLRRLSEVTDRDLDVFRSHVLSLAKSPGRKSHLLQAVRTLWAFGQYLPAECRLPGKPWGGASGRELAGDGRVGRFNQTPRIAAETMEALLAWSLRMVEVIGPDIRDAWVEYRQADRRRPPAGAVRGLIDGHPWREHPITVTELYDLVRFLTAARFVVVCYLSGARPGEVLNLHAGCRATDTATGHLLVTGRRGKGRSNPPTDASGQHRPWTVVQPVHAAIAMLESLSASSLLFPASLVKPQPRRPNDGNARTSRYMTNDIEQFTEWVNTTFVAAGGAPVIPSDPTRNIHPRRFRRTLAYFIVRRPRGLIAAALQYGHVSTKVTLSYAGSADNGWMENLAVERLEMVLEQTDRDWTLLESGEHVSGPSAAEYRARVGKAEQFSGRVINQVRNAERLLAQADPGIHHGEGMTCVWRAETAVCRTTKLEQGLPANDGPDESGCRSTCQNLAYTDRDIDQLRTRLTVLESAAADPLSPRPLRDRAAAQASAVRTITDRHENVRPSGTPPPGTTA